MSIEINGKTYYRTAEVCAKAGIKKTYRDRRGWRMFTESDLETMRAEADMIKVEDSPKNSDITEKIPSPGKK